MSYGHVTLSIDWQSFESRKCYLFGFSNTDCDSGSVEPYSGSKQDPFRERLYLIESAIDRFQLTIPFVTIEEKKE